VTANPRRGRPLAIAALAAALVTIAAEPPVAGHGRVTAVNSSA